MIVAITPNAVILGLGVAGLGAGLGFGMPGIMSGPSLLPGRIEQSSVAGLVDTAIALTFALSPLTATE